MVKNRQEEVRGRQTGVYQSISFSYPDKKTEVDLERPGLAATHTTTTTTTTKQLQSHTIECIEFRVWHVWHMQFLETLFARPLT